MNAVLKIATVLLILGLAAAVYFGDPPTEVFRSPDPSNRAASGIAGLMVVAFGLFAMRLTRK